MDNDKIKEAFNRAKQDIDSLKSDIFYLNQDILEIKQALQTLLDYETNKPTNQQTQQAHTPTPQHINQAQISQNTTQNAFPTQEIPYKALKEHFKDSSTGNDGVPTNQQTNQQTNQHPPISHGNSVQNSSKLHINENFDLQKPQKMTNSDKISHLEQISNVLSTLDNIKKELRIKFKRLTPQEMLVFSAIYSLENEGFIVDYSTIASKLNLSEISIRDYTRKLIKKGIPLLKSSEDNKKIQLSVSQDLKKIASLNTILALREL
jgi:ribosomal protein S8